MLEFSSLQAKEKKMCEQVCVDGYSAWHAVRKENTLQNDFAFHSCALKPLIAFFKKKRKKKANIPMHSSYILKTSVSGEDEILHFTTEMLCLAEKENI